MKKITLLFLLFSLNTAFAQVGINSDNSNPDASAMLDVKSTTSGLLIPRMTTTERDNISSPATGLTVYVTDDNTFYYYNGTTWTPIQEGGKSWLLSGNTGTTGAEFLGTTDAQPLIFKTNNVERVRINDAGNIGINTPPDANNQITAIANDKDVIGHFESTRTSSDDIGVEGVAASDDYWGIGGYFKGGYIGAYGTVSPTGSYDYYGVEAYVSGGTGTNYGVYSIANNGNTNHAGKFISYSGGGSGTVNYGISSIASGGETNYAGYFLTFTAADYGSAGYFINIDDNGNGIIVGSNNVNPLYYYPDGEAVAATGKMVAISGYSENDDDNTVCIRGVYKGSDTYDATGVLGLSTPTDYYGYGVKGIGGWIGVYGETDSNGWYGVYSNGDFGASGTKSFMIDHPLDPENKYLKHFSIESNEVLNVYRGNAVLDANGEANIQLPNYFHAVNKNFSYMLTPVGQPAPDIYVSKEIDTNGTFTIAGGHAGQKISWYVYAERNDPYLQQHPEKRQVEVPKRNKDRGKYLMPDLYNQPKNKALNNTNIHKARKIKPKKINLTPTDPKQKNIK